MRLFHVFDMFEATHKTMQGWKDDDDKGKLQIFLQRIMELFNIKH